MDNGTLTLSPAAFVCQNCIHWAEVSRAQLPPDLVIQGKRLGVCWGAPPMVSVQADPRTGQPLTQRNLRPWTQHNERGCGMFAPTPEAMAGLETPANDPTVS